MNKLRPNDWERKLYRAAIEFTNNEISEDQYIDMHIGTDSWPEIPLLKKSMNLYSLFLKKLSLKNRRMILRNSSELTYDEISRMLGVGREKITGFLFNKVYKEEKSFVAIMAIIFRVPFSWVDQIDITEDWETYHFNFLTDSVMDESHLMNLLNNKEITHLVRGITLKIGDGIRNIYLRLEIKKGNFVIEFCNVNPSADELRYLLNLLKPYKCKLGLIYTVIPNHKNTVFISQDCSENQISLPLEYDDMNLVIRPFSV